MMTPKGSRRVARELLHLFILGALAGGATWSGSVALASEKSEGGLRIYPVNKKVSEFPEGENLSTPEGAYVAINRAMANGEQGAWRRLSVQSLAERMPPADAPRREVPAEAARSDREAQIVEVRTFRGTFAAVIAKLPGGMLPSYDKRTLGWEEGRWLNRGQTIFPSIAQARASFARQCAGLVQETQVRPAVADPQAYIKPFVQFLQDHAEEPEPFVMRAVADHELTIIGEIHHRPRYWAFNGSLVNEPDFPDRVGTIYLELPSHAQPLVDVFLASEDCDTSPVIEALRDMLWMGWPDQAMLDFFVTVWMRNRSLSPEQRLRIVLVDMPRPWSEINERRDLIRYETDRDKLMADNILKDMREHPDEPRHRLFIVGVGHTGLNLEYVPDCPVMTAGWHLREALGPGQVYAIIQHRAVQTNTGAVSGRLCFGLFDSAFAALGNRPMAFPLDTGPFGAEAYDADPDNPVNCTYADGFNAYLYLGPLETEIFSPLIAGFYNHAFVQELDRRFRITNARSWAEAYRQQEMTPESFIAWMSNSWGKPRAKWGPGVVGPLDAWHRGGSNWRQPLIDEKLAHVMEHPEEVVQAARQLFEDIQNADYDAFLSGTRSWDRFPTMGRYMARTRHDTLREWICRIFKDNPIVSIDVGEAFLGDAEILGKRGWPTVPYKLTLADGTALQGQLAFGYDFDADQGHWHGMEGIDWHLRPELNPSAPIDP